MSNIRLLLLRFFIFIIDTLFGLFGLEISLYKDKAWLGYIHQPFRNSTWENRKIWEQVLCLPTFVHRLYSYYLYQMALHGYKWDRDNDKWSLM